MPVLAIANQKGGVGKTTTAVNLSAALAGAQRRVLLIDCDPQSNATSNLGETPGAAASIYDVFAERVSIRSCVRSTQVPGLSLVPSSPELAGGEIELATAQQREFRLRGAVAELADSYDYVLLDCSPSLGLLTLNALTAASGVLIPVQCEYMALEGLTHLTTTISLVQAQLNPALTVAGLILTMYDARTNLAQAVVEEVRGHFPATLRTVIPRSVRLSEAPSHGKTIFEYAPGSRGAEAYAQLAQELIARLEQVRADTITASAIIVETASFPAEPRYPHTPDALPAPHAPEPAPTEAPAPVATIGAGHIGGGQA